MRIKFLAVLLCLASGTLEAQAGTREYALIYGRNIKKGDLVTAIRNCDKKVLRPPCSEVIRNAVGLGFIMADAAKVVHKDSLNLLAPQFAEYIATLTVKPCPLGARTVSTEWAPKERMLFVSSHAMDCTQGENLLWDGERPVLSLYDGHLISQYYASPATTVASATTAAETTQAGKPSVDQRNKLDSPVPPPKRTTSEKRIATGGKEREQVPVGPGPRGPQGLPGLNCWDLNQNGQADILAEDVNRDGVVNINDCRGPQGPQGLPGIPTVRGHNLTPLWVVLGLLGAGAIAGCAIEWCQPGKVEQKTDVGVHVNGFAPSRMRRQFAIPIG